MSYQNINPDINAIAAAQGIEVGSALWKSGGPAALASSTGGQPSYGWNHDYKLTQSNAANWVRAVIANYASRRCYYINAPLRQNGYPNAGRPVGWIPEDSLDQANGQTIYQTSNGPVTMSGPDVLHFQINPLFTVFDSKGFTVKAKGKDWDASYVAGILIRLLMASLAGQMRANTGYLWGDRGACQITMNFTRAIKRGLVNPEDIKTFQDWLANAYLDEYEKAPGLNVNQFKDNGMPPPNIQTYNGLFWVLGGSYELWSVTPDSAPWKPRFEQIIRRWAQFLVDLDEVQPEAFLDIDCFAATPEILAGINGLPLETLDGKLTPDQILVQGSTDWGLWGFRAAMTAEKLLGAAAKPLADKMKAKWLPKVGVSDNKVWLVDAENKYL